MVSHEVVVQDGVVMMYNNADDFYVQYFRTLEEVDEFISKLQKAKEECWG